MAIRDYILERSVNIAMQQLLDSCDALPEGGKHRVATEILRRVSAGSELDMPDSALVEAADELFGTVLALRY